MATDNQVNPDVSKYLVPNTTPPPPSNPTNVNNYLVPNGTPVQSGTYSTPVGNVYVQVGGTSLGGSLSSGGGSSGTATETTATPSQTEVGGAKLGSPQGQQAGVSAAQVVSVNQQGNAAVQIGNTGYTGNQYIPQLQMTANDYAAKVKKEAIKSGQVKESEQNNYAYKVQTQQTQQQAAAQPSQSSNASVEELSNNAHTFAMQEINASIQQGQGIMPSILSEGANLLNGVLGENLIGLGGTFGIFGTPLITAKQIQTEVTNHSSEIANVVFSSPFKPASNIQKNVGSFAIQTAAQFIPTTPLAVAETGGAIAFYPELPVIARLGVSGGTAVLGVEGALNSQGTAPQRVASGLVGGLGAFGLVSESLPYLRGFGANSPVEIEPQGFKAVQLNDAEIKKIGLIQTGYPSATGETANIELPEVSPLVRGGFHVQPQDKALFLGSDQTLATSQIGLFKEGVNVPIERPFYATPEEPFLNIAETRVSRLGLNEGLFSSPKNAQIGFGLPKTPQIGLFPETSVGTSETALGFEIGKGTELEAIKTYGTITDVRKLGKTAYKMQGVDIYTAKMGFGEKNANLNLKSFAGSSFGGTRVSGESALSTAFISKTFFPTTKTTTKTITKALTNTFSTTAKNPFTFSTTKRGTGSTATFKISTPTFQTRTTATPRTSIRSPFSFPTSKPSSSTSASIKYSAIFSKKQPLFFGLGDKKTIRSPSKNLDVFAKFGGLWKEVGRATSVNQAIREGEFATKSGKIKSFNIKGANFLPSKLKGYKTSNEPFGFIYTRK